MEEYWKIEEIHQMARKSNVTCLEAYFCQVDITNGETVKRWSHKYPIFSVYEWHLREKEKKLMTIE